MVTAEELTVAIRSEGVGETQQDLEGVESAMQETADSAGDSAEELEGFSERFQGAMSAAVAALAVGAAGLLSQVPVLGEAFAGLAAVVQAVAFQMDSVLRPVITPITDALFRLSNAIFEADGIVGDFIGTIATIASVAAVVITTVAAVGAQLGTFASTLGGISSILGTIGSVIAGIIGAISATVAAIAIAVAAIVGFAAAYITNFKGVRDTTNRIIGQIIDFVVTGFSSLADRAVDAISGLAGRVKSVLSGIAADITSWASGLASDAFQWGKDLINRFVSGIKSVLGTLREWLNELGDVAATVGIDIPSIDGLGGGGGGGGSNSTGRSGGGRFTSTGGTRIDGRQLTESTGRYRSDPGRRRGL